MKTTAQRQVTWNLLMCPDWDSNQGSGERQLSEKLIVMIYTINNSYFAMIKVYLSRMSNFDGNLTLCQCRGKCIHGFECIYCISFESKFGFYRPV